VIVSGLTEGSSYRFRVFEYNQNADTGDHALYLLGDHPVAFVPEPSSTLLKLAMLVTIAVLYRLKRANA